MDIQVLENLRRSAASFLLSRLASLPRRRMGDAWLTWRLRVVGIASKTLREKEAETRSREAELKASMEKGLRELRVGKEGLEVPSCLFESFYRSSGGRAMRGGCISWTWH